MERLRHDFDLSVHKWCVLNQRPLVATRRDCVMWVKCTTSAEDQNSKYLAVSPVTDNIEQLRPEAVGRSRHSNFSIKFDGFNKGVEVLGVAKKFRKLC